MNLNKRKITVGVVVGFLTACGSAEKRVESVTEASITLEKRADLYYKVRPGDSLSRIAQSTTGNGGNWREIARYNKIQDPNKLKKNDTIIVPSHLLPVKKSENPASVVVAANPKKEEPEKSATTTKWVMVEGSYYPKAIYRKPDYSAGMLTRVLPGTTLKHIKSGKNWIEVETTKGRGYLHRSDARELRKKELSLNTRLEY